MHLSKCVVFCGIKLQKNILSDFCVATFLGTIQPPSKRSALNLILRTKPENSFFRLKFEYFWRSYVVVFGIGSEKGQCFLFQLADSDQNPGNKGKSHSLCFYVLSFSHHCHLQLDYMGVGKTNHWFLLQKGE